MTRCSAVLVMISSTAATNGNGDYTGIVDKLYGEAGNDDLHTLDGNDYLKRGSRSG